MHPFSIISQEGVSENDEFSDHGGESDFCGFSGFDEGLIFSFEVMVEAGCDESRHIDGLPQLGSSASDEALPFQLPDSPGCGARPASEATCR